MLAASLVAACSAFAGPGRPHFARPATPRGASPIALDLGSYCFLAPSLCAPPEPAPLQLLHEISAAAEGFSHLYYAALQSHYFETTALQAFVLVSVGDIGAQAIENQHAEGAPPIDLKRTMRMGTLGLFIAGVGTARWLQFLEQNVPANGSAQAVMEKACLDATIWAPIANTLYLVLTPLLEGVKPEAVASDVKAKFVPVMRAEVMTYFPYNLISFSLIPPLLRPFTTGFVSMCFAIYISWITHNERAVEPAVEPAGELCPGGEGDAEGCLVYG